MGEDGKDRKLWQEPELHFSALCGRGHSCCCAWPEAGTPPLQGCTYTIVSLQFPITVSPCSCSLQPRAFYCPFHFDSHQLR